MILSTCYNYYKYQVISFGLTNTLITFQGYINKIPTEKLNVFIMVYLDDILIYTKNKRKKYMEAL